jgi:cytochrome c553
MFRILPCILVLLYASTAVVADEQSATSAPLTAAQTEFFETKIRPILVKHCYQCHSQEAQGRNQLKGGLLLDSRQGTLAGGDSGAAVVPHKPDESPLLNALRYDGLKMPPKGKLPDSVIADFANWVNDGAPDPRDGKAVVKPAGIDLVAGRKHWAYQPVQNLAAPVVNRKDWPAGSIDQFILNRLESKGLEPGGDADRMTLIRRVYFDLIGLPPAPEQIDEFVNSTTPDAYERLVDQLLASPEFGERWGRHWLDVVRFGESLTLRGFIMPEAWRYRDYVIDSINADRPFNQGLIEQVAGDLIPVNYVSDSRAEMQRRLVATTFLTLGNTNLEEQDKVQLRMDVVDEQLDVISKGILGQTVTCARCHDHKFDPIPTRDYYALAGILRNAKTLEHANVSKWLEFPLPVEPAVERQLKQLQTAMLPIQEKIKSAKDALKALTATSPTGPNAEVVDGKSFPGVVVDDAQAKRVGEWKLSQHSKRYIGEGYLHDLDSKKGEKTLTFQPELPKAGIYEVRLAYTADSNRAPAVPVTVFSADGEKTVTVNQIVAPPIDGRFVSLGKFRFEQNGQGFVIVANEGTRGHVIADAVQFIPSDMLEAGFSPATPGQSKTVDSPATAMQIKERKQEIASLEKQLTGMLASGPTQHMFMSVQEEKSIEDCPIHIRGTVHNLGEKVPRGFLQVASWTSNPALSNEKSGRLELGNWLVDRQNPLTARVMANRVWHWLLGSGIVRTVDNFGTTGELPSHPELLDHLATEFMEQGWSIKSLVRRIVLSRTYRLASAGSVKLMHDDPENRLFGRANRRRLDAECLLDSMLLVSGQLDRQAGGPGIRPGTASDFSYEFRTSRRAVYWPVLRNCLPELFEVFDFPDPSMVGGGRNVSTVAPQALFLMNSKFVMQHSQFAAELLLRDLEPSNEARIDMAFRRVLGRPPKSNERIQALNFVTAETMETEKQKAQRWSRFVQALFGTLDFRYLD